MLAPCKKSYNKPRQCIKKQRHYFANKDPSSQSCDFPVFCPGEFNEVYSPWGHKELDTTEQPSLSYHKCDVFESSRNHPDPQKTCLPQNQPLAPKRLETTAIKKQPFCFQETFFFFPT